MYKLLKLATNDWINASRDKRELLVAMELGFDVSVMAKGEYNENGKREEIDGFCVHRYTTRPFRNLRVMKRINRALSLILWAFHASRFNAHVISCHDLIALFIGYISNFFRLKSGRALLIYDSHEFEIGSNANRNYLQQFIVIHLERFLIKRSVYSIMVNDFIADEVCKIHSLRQRPIVVRNIPNYWQLDNSIVNEYRKRIFDSLSCRNVNFIVMYHGNIAKGRGIERILEALKEINDVAGVILGNGEKKYIEELKDLCINNNIEDRVLFLPSVPHNELWKYVGSADVGIIPIENSIKNHLYSLPNKYFENIQAMTPIINNDLPAMSAITEKYQIGVSIDCSNPINISDAIKEMKEDVSFYKSLKRNLILAKDELCWEKEQRALKEMYASILNKLDQLHSKEKTSNE